MKIVINTAHQRFGGAIQVALSFIYECRKFPEHEYHVWVGPGVRKFLCEEDFPANFYFLYFDFGAISLGKTFTINRNLQQAEGEIKPDCIIATSGPSYFHSCAPQIIGYNLPLYIYPESPFIQTKSPYRKFLMALKKHLHFYFFKRDAIAFVVQTDDVNQRLRMAFDTDQVYTVTNTYSALYLEPQSFASKLPPKQKGQLRFITISSYYGHKNLELIPTVLDELQRRGHNNIQFVLTLKPEDFQTKIGGDHGGKILNVGPVKPQECPALYAECDALFLPTLAECFSASYPEAMVMGKPIITTDLGFARGICGEAALFYEPQNPKAAADAIIRLINDDVLWKDLIIKGKERLKVFDTPKQRTEKYLDICKKYARNSFTEGNTD